MTTSKKRNLYVTPDHEAALKSAYEQMKAAGVRVDYGGKMNASAVILEALRYYVREAQKRA